MFETLSHGAAAASHGKGDVEGSQASPCTGALGTRTGSACALQLGFLAGRLAGEPRSVSFGVRGNWGVWEGMHKIPVLPSEDRRASA